MLLRILFNAAPRLFRWKASSAMLKNLRKNGMTTASDLALKSGVSSKTAWVFLKTLEKTEHVMLEGRFFYRVNPEMFEDNAVIVNLRDRLSDSLFKRVFTRRISLSLATQKPSSLKEMLSELGVPPRTGDRVIADLRDVGIVTGLTVRKECLKRAKPIQLIPRRAHRVVVEDFLRAVRTYAGDFSEPIILFGDASWGAPLPSLDILGLTESLAPEGMRKFIKALVDASSAITLQTGVLFKLAVAAVDVWLAQQLQAARPSTLITRAQTGICVHGKLPSKDDYFQLMSRSLPITTEKIDEWLEKGYARKTMEGKMVFTEKAFQRWRQHPSEVFEETLNIDGKPVQLIGLKAKEIS